MKRRRARGPLCQRLTSRGLCRRQRLDRIGKPDALDRLSGWLRQRWPRVGSDPRLSRSHFNKVWWLCELDEIEAARRLEGARSAQLRLERLCELTRALRAQLERSLCPRLLHGPLRRADLLAYVGQLERRLKMDEDEIQAWRELELERELSQLALSALARPGPRSRLSALCERA